MKLGLVGARGMVGSVLVDRMVKEKDFDNWDTTFFSTSQKGEDNLFKHPKVKSKLEDAYSLENLKAMDVILTCQGSDYTNEIHPKLRAQGWRGFWVDAASTLRMKDDSVIVLDPINHQGIKEAIVKGKKDFIGGNCTVSLMLLGLGGLIEKGWVEWVTSMTYQAASGAGAKNMAELLSQSKFVGDEFVSYQKLNPAASILDIERRLMKRVMEEDFPRENFGHPLALNLLPWIDTKLDNGQSKEEWKARAEANKILGLNNTLPIDGTCVRVGSLRCHAQGLTVKLKKDIPLKDIEEAIKSHNEWVKFVPNDKETTLRELTPVSIAGALKIGVGRVRKMNLGPEYLNVFTLGDQLLWGAAEPLRRMLSFLL